MKLSHLIQRLDVIKTIGDTDIDVQDVCFNSNEATENSLFICLNGRDFDGHSFALQAEKYGAVALVCEKEMDSNLPQIIVKNTRIALSIIASEFFGRPDKSMKIIGVTGTNGKTSTTHIIKCILDSAGIKCGVIGTLGAFYDDKYIEMPLTTPDPLLLHKTLAEMRDASVKVVVMEVSAHALYYDKIEGMDFEVGIFTNLTQDHLDFFNSMEEYERSKLKFFDNNRCKYIVVNADDDVGIKILNSHKNVVTYGMDNPSDVFAIDCELTKNGSTFVLNLFDMIFDIKLNLMGKFNVYNSMAGATATALFGVPTDQIAKGLCKLQTVSGRLELVYDKEYSVFVDYAHTPDGLEKSLNSLKSVCKNKLICVFGCGGNRDKEKRPLMGEISGNTADFTIITSDNPRYEEPMDIISEVEKGILKTKGKYIIVQDRTEGIRYAINLAKDGDTILVAGKGAEDYQEILGIKHIYNDKTTIKEIIRGKTW